MTLLGIGNSDSQSQKDDICPRSVIHNDKYNCCNSIQTNLNLLAMPSRRSNLTYSASVLEDGDDYDKRWEAVVQVLIENMADIGVDGYYKELDTIKKMDESVLVVNQKKRNVKDILLHITQQQQIHGGRKNLSTTSKSNQKNPILPVTIIYVWRREDAENLSTHLRSLNLPSACYHAVSIFGVG